MSAVNVKVSSDNKKLVTYIQDATGGIKVVGLDAKKGQRVQVTGTVQSENGLLSLLTQEVIMLDEKEGSVPIQPVASNEAAANEGTLATVTGNVTAKTADTLTLNNELTVYLDPTVGSMNEITVGQSVTVSGLIVVNEQQQPRLILSSIDDLVVNKVEPFIPNTMET